MKITIIIRMDTSENFAIKDPHQEESVVLWMGISVMVMSMSDLKGIFL